jgi:arylsulfatase
LASEHLERRLIAILADLEVPEAGVEGMIATHGGLEGGYGLYVRDGRPTFVYNYLALERYWLAATTQLPKGKVQLKVDFAYSGRAGEVGRAATVTMTANGAKVGNAGHIGPGKARGATCCIVPL